MATRSDLLQVGQHCSFETCNLQDFLPFKCKCDQTFCRDHVFPESHACLAVKPALTDEEVAEGGGKVRKCDVEGCNKSTLYAFSSHPERETCDACKGSYCVSHRHTDTHSCNPPLEDSNSEPSAARQLLQKNFGSALSSASQTKASSSQGPKKKKLPTDPVKLAQYKKIELMKMRNKAIPADIKDKASSVSSDQRLTVNVRYGKSEKVFWLRKSVSGGKAIDLLSTQLQVNPSLKTRICRVDAINDEEETLRNDTGLGEQVEDGATLALVHDSQKTGS